MLPDRGGLLTQHRDLQRHRLRIEREAIRLVDLRTRLRPVQSSPASAPSILASNGFAAASITMPMMYCSRSAASESTSFSAPAMISGTAASAMPAVAIAAAWSAMNAAAMSTRIAIASTFWPTT